VTVKAWLCLCAAAGFLVLAASSPALAEHVTIREWLPRTEGYREFLKTAGDEFKKNHPDIDIVVEDFPSETYRTTLAVGLAGANPPDVFVEWAGADAAQLVRDRLALDITALGKEQDGFVGEVSAGWLSAFEVNGKYYGVPTDGLSTYFYYNKSFFAKKKLDRPTDFESLVGLCKKIREINPTIVPIAFGNSPRWPLGHYMTMLNERVLGLDALTKDYDLTNPEDKLFSDLGYGDAWNRLLDMQSVRCFDADPNAISMDASRAAFSRQQSPMIYCGTWCAPIFDHDGFTDYALFRMPRMSGSKSDDSANFLMAEGMMLSAKSSHPKEAAAWASFVVSDAMAEKFAEKLKVIPSNPKLIANVAGATEQYKWIASDMVSFSKAIAPLDDALESSVAEAYLDQGAAILNGSTTPSEAMDKIRDAALAAKKKLGR
jgi:raffinose/stachyose/melibiose transport system substrate-binding protein